MCPICLSEPPTVALLPCCHGVCYPCLNQLRAAVVHQAAHTLRCPLCRAPVTATEGGAGEAGPIASSNAPRAWRTQGVWAAQPEQPEAAHPSDDVTESITASPIAPMAVLVRTDHRVLHCHSVE